MKQILIVEPDEQFAGRLFQALLQVGDYQISSTPTVREACLIVGRQAQDLAFVPLEGLAGTVEALRRLQPDLPLIVTLPTAETSLPPEQLEQVQGLLPRPALAIILPELLADVMAQTRAGEQRGNGPSPADLSQSGSGEGALTPLLQGTVLPEAILAVLVSQGEQLLAHAGTLTARQAQLVADRVAGSWQPDLTAQIQFILLPSRTSDLQLYTRPAAADWLLTLVARAETKMEMVRVEAEELCRQIREVAGEEGRKPAGERPGDSPILVRVQEQQSPAATKKSYALVWRALGPLPEPLRIALGRALERIAAENHCELGFLSVEEQLVHLVASCPSERGSGWAAHLFKQEAEAAIQAQFGVEKQLWQKGYYAVESDEPVSAAELNLIKQKDT